MYVILAKYLTNFNVFDRKKKLIHYWTSTTNTGTSGATVLAHNNMTAFKFPDKQQVFLTCNIEVGRPNSKLSNTHFVFISRKEGLGKIVEILYPKTEHAGKCI